MTNLSLFDGYEVQADTIDLPGVGKVPLAKVKGDLDVHINDAFELRLLCYIGGPAFGTSGIDGQGNLKGEFDRHFKAYADKHDYEIGAYILKQERDAKYLSDHGAVG